MRVVRLAHPDGTWHRITAYDPVDDDDGWTYPTVVICWRASGSEQWQVIDVVSEEGDSAVAVTTRGDHVVDLERVSPFL